jgi:hypothetical protein
MVAKSAGATFINTINTCWSSAVVVREKHTTGQEPFVGQVAAHCCHTKRSNLHQHHQHLLAKQGEYLLN